MKYFIYLIISLFIISFSSFGQDTILDAYINEGLKSNLALQQKQASYQKSIYALKEAKGLFMPDISLNARYSLADGGRTIAFPIGDMMNPVYQNLNQINQALTPGAEAYPMLENEEFPFFRPKEHETKVQVIQPIFNSEIIFNNQIKKELVLVEKADVGAYKRTLVAEIKIAYYNYLQTIEALDLLDKTKILLTENIKFNESLFRNNTATIDLVYRSKSELAKLEQEKAQAVKYNKSAKAYFNFLLNKPLNEPIEKSNLYDLIPLDSTNISASQESAVQNREELVQLQHYTNIADKAVKMNKFNMLPSLTAVVDYGYQGEKYEFTNEYDFTMASFVLQWDLFKGFQNKNKIQQAILEKQIIDSKHQEVKQQISLQVINAYYDLEAAYKSIDAAQLQLEAGEKAFRIIQKKYKGGQVNLLQFIDARTTMTNAAQNLIITKYNFNIKYAEFEKVTGQYQF